MARTFVNAGGASLTQGLLLGKAAITTMPLSFACWYNPANVTTIFDLMGMYSAGGTVYFAFGAHSNAQVGASQWGTVTGSEARSTVTVSIGTWAHLVGVFLSATSRTIYVNGGNSVNETTNDGTTAATESCIGSVNGAGSFGASNGSIAFPAFWNVALTAADILSLSLGVSPLRIRPQNLVSYTRLSAGSSPEPDICNTSWSLTGTPAVVANPRIYAP
jgi:hypothetical protein